MQNLYKDVAKLLEKDERFFAEGKILKNIVTEAVLKMDSKLFDLLLENPKLKEHFFVQAKDNLVFDQNKFIKFINNKEFLPDSFTSFKNHIGLETNDEYLNENGNVVLAWPYKDCVLEGGQDKEDTKRNEIFYNETLAPDEIDRLFESKVLTNFKKIDETGEHKLDGFNRDGKGMIKDNLIIKGNNLLALASLKKEFTGKVKLIYIDPPYYFSDKKSGDTFVYNTNFKLSSWLVFMKNRLAIARDLLTKDGSIFIQISDEGLGYLRCLLDDVFKPENFLNIISVQAKSIAGASGGGEDKKLKKNTEFIILYCKDYLNYSPNKVYKEIPLKFLIEDKQREGKEYEYKQILLSSGKRKAVAKIKTGDGEDIVVFGHTGYEVSSVKQIKGKKPLDIMEIYNQYYEKIFRTHDAQSSIRHKVVEVTEKDGGLYSIEYYPRSGKNKGKLTTNFYFKNELVGFLTNTSVKKAGEIIKLREVGSLWDDIGWDGIAREGGVKLKAGKKPERLLQRIVELSTGNNDLVMDYHLGSGTTCAVAHKMGRQFIGIEQLNYGENDNVVRLKNVIAGEQNGISKEANWAGGGSFIYMELKQWNEKYIQIIQEAKTAKDLVNLYKKMQKEAFFRYEIDLSKFDQAKLTELPLDEQKQVLIECLDKNHLYVNYSEMDDSTYKVSTEEKKINKLFYGR